MSEATADLLTVPQAAERLSVSVRTTWSLIGSGALPSVKVGGSRRVPVAGLETYVATLQGGDRG